MQGLLVRHCSNYKWIEYSRLSITSRMSSEVIAKEANMRAHLLCYNWKFKLTAVSCFIRITFIHYKSNWRKIFLFFLLKIRKRSFETLNCLEEMLSQLFANSISGQAIWFNPFETLSILKSHKWPKGLKYYNKIALLSKQCPKGKL